MTDTTSKQWVRTPDIYGKPICIHELDYANGTYVAHCESHPNDTDPFETIIISNDLQHWQHRVTSPARDYKLKNIRLTGKDNTFIAVGTQIQDTGNHLIVMTSDNGFDWTDKFISEKPADSNEAYIVKSIGGGVVGCSTGKVVFSANLEDWKITEYAGKYLNYSTLDVTYFDGKFFVLLKYRDSYAIGYSSGLSEFTFYDIDWGKSVPNCLESNTNQMVVVCSEGLAERCAVYYTTTGVDTMWNRIELKMPYRNITSSLSEMFSAAWLDNQWTFVGRVSEWNNSRSMLFSYTGVIFCCEGDVTPESNLILDSTDARDLTYIQNFNGKLFAWGQAHPNGDNCLYTIE